MGPPRMPRGTQPPDPIQDAIERAKAGGSSALPDELRGRLEGSLGTELSDVRIHTGGEAAAAAGELDAHAFALGQDVFFASGQYDPGTPQGQALIAHEVAHTVQQRGASEDVQAKLEVSTPGDAHEDEADRFAESFVAGGTAPVTRVAAGSIARKAIARQSAGPVRQPRVAGEPAGQQPGGQPPGPSTEARVSELERRQEINNTLAAMHLSIDAAYTDLESRLTAAYAPYETAYDLHVGSLQAHAARVRLAQDIMISVLFAGLGGAAGGALQTVIRGTSQALLTQAVATAGADIGKYLTRLPDQPTTATPGAAGGANPMVWLTGMVSGIKRQHAALLRVLIELRRDIDPARAVIDGDPLAAIDAHVASLDGLAQVREPQFYSLALWRRWLETAIATRTSREQLTGFMIEYRGVLQDITAQCGAEGTAMMAQLTCNSATNGPANVDALNRPVDSVYATCQPETR